MSRSEKSCKGCKGVSGHGEIKISTQFLECLGVDSERLRDRLDALAYRGIDLKNFRYDLETGCFIVSCPVSEESEDA